MNKIYLLMAFAAFLFSCSDEEGSGDDFAEQIVGGWILEQIRVEGADCQTIFGTDVPDMYMADIEGCARPTEILGNAKRCVNVTFNADGTGSFLWSEINGQQDAAITYTITNNEIEYCATGGVGCGGPFKLVGGKLESSADLRLDQTCRSIFVLRKK